MSSIFDTTDFSKDEDLPIEDLLAGMKTEENEVKKPEIKKSIINENKEETKQVEELSPLEKMKQQNSNAISGLKISNEDLKEGEDGPKRNIVYNDNRMNEFEAAINEYDDSIKKRNAVIVTAQPQDQFEYVELITEIDSVMFDVNGKAYFALVDDEGKPKTPKYCRLRETDEDAFDYSVLSEYEQKEINKSSNSEDTSSDDEDISEEKKKIVEVIIDKTGLGTDFAFTEEEKAKISEAETIRVNEVKVVDIAAIRAKRSTKSFQDTIKEFNLQGSRTTICFPASGFRAQMKGLTYGEYADISLSMENVTFDQYYKRLTIIYNKMTNISTGPFKDFEDFLKKFAYTDIPLAIYGMFIATENENQEIALRCGNESCKRTFDWHYSTRSLLRLDRCADTFLKKMQEIATSPAIEYDNIKANSAVENSKVIELPESGFAVEMGIASAYDFLYNFIPLMNEDTFKEAFGDDLNEIYMNNVLLLTTVRSVYVPNGDEYIECVGYKDILDAIYNISPSEIQILAAYAAKIQGEYEVTFAFENVSCPHCKNITKHLDITIDDLVFQTYQRLMSTEVDLSQIQDF